MRTRLICSFIHSVGNYWLLRLAGSFVLLTAHSRTPVLTLGQRAAWAGTGQLWHYLHLSIMPRPTHLTDPCQDQTNPWVSNEWGNRGSHQAKPCSSLALSLPLPGEEEQLPSSHTGRCEQATNPTFNQEVKHGQRLLSQKSEKKRLSAIKMHHFTENRDILP